jgi:hypothetical protein
VGWCEVELGRQWAALAQLAQGQVCFFPFSFLFSIFFFLSFQIQISIPF